MGKRFSSVVLISILSGFSNPLFSQGIGLEEVIREVCTKSDSVKMMQETLIKSDQMIREKWSNAFPIISASLDGGRSVSNLASTMPSIANLMPPGMSTINDVTRYATSIDITQPIFTFGKIGTAIEVASQFNKSTKSTYRRNIQQLQLLALDAFFRVVLSDIALDIAKRSLARKKELYDFLDRNFKLGSGSKAQILATKADLMGQVPAVFTAQEDLQNAKMGLNMLMGRSLMDSVRLDTAAGVRGLLSMAILPEKEALRTALDEREDLRTIDFLAEANKGGAKLYNAMYLPSIAATGSFGTVGTEPKDITDWDNKNWSVGVGLKWTLFDGFANNSLSRQYRSDSRKLEIARTAIAKTIEIEISTALIECTAADSNLAAMEEVLSAARESYSLTNDNFRQGSGQFADLQLAEERLRQSEMGIVSARYRQLRSRAVLLVAMGKDIVKINEEEK
jgi:HAE1 family hydrophobic/amphiphilic exporter-1